MCYFTLYLSLVKNWNFIIFFSFFHFFLQKIFAFEFVFAESFSLYLSDDVNFSLYTVVQQVLFEKGNNSCCFRVIRFCLMLLCELASGIAVCKIGVSVKCIHIEDESICSIYIENVCRCRICVIFQEIL